MAARDKEDNSYLLRWKEEDQETYYLGQNDKVAEVEEWLDSIFHIIRIEYNAETCKEIMGGWSQYDKWLNTSIKEKKISWLARGLVNKVMGTNLRK